MTTGRHRKPLFQLSWDEALESMDKKALGNMPEARARKLLAEALANLTWLSTAADSPEGIDGMLSPDELGEVVHEIGAKVEKAFLVLGGQKQELIDAQREHGERERKTAHLRAVPPAGKA
jgi:hypothetical protein